MVSELSDKAFWIAFVAGSIAGGIGVIAAMQYLDMVSVV